MLDEDGRLVMVVDDDEEIRDALADVLHDEGYSVIRAGDGRQALAYLRDGRRPDAIILDLWMPIMDGWQLRRELLTDSSLSAIPVVALTAARDQRSSTLQVSEILTKPVELGRLLHVLKSITTRAPS